MENHELTRQQLAAMSDQQLRGMVNVAEIHVRENGPIAFGGFLLWYYRVPWLSRIFRCGN